MKKITACLLAVILVFSMAVPAFAAVTPTVSATAVTAGSDVTVTLKLDETLNGITTLDYRLYFDSELFDLKTSSNGDAHENTKITGVKTDKNTNKTYVGISLVDTESEGYTVNAGTLYTVVFTAKEDLTEEQTAAFELTRFSMMDNTWGDPGTGVVTNGTVTVTVQKEAPSVTKYTIDISNITKGTVNADKAEAAEGETVTLTAVPDEGYELKKLTYTKNEEGADPVDVESGVPFEMPAADITVNAEFGLPYNGYYFTTSADTTTTEGGTATVSVYVTGHTNSEIDGYNAYDVTLTFPKELLSYQSYDGAVKGESGEVKLGADGTTIHIVGCGAKKNFDQPIVVLTFEMSDAGTAEVKVGTAQISDKETAVDTNVPNAIAQHKADDPNADSTPDSTLIIVPFNVDKPDYVLGDKFVKEGGKYTFSFFDPEHYEYSSLSVTMGGDSVDNLTPDTNGFYTIENVTGNIVIEVTQKAVSYQVFFEKDGATVEGEGMAVYGEPYTFTVTPSSGKDIESVSVAYAEGGSNIEYSINENGEYEIAAKYITGPIQITVKQKDAPVVEDKITNITFSGITEAEIEGGLTQQVKAGVAKTFTLKPISGYKYAVKIGETPLTLNEDGTFTISAEQMTEGSLTVTIEKTEIVKVEVANYIKLDGQMMFLVTAKPAAEDSASVLKYGEKTMFYSDKYALTDEAAGAFCWLVISDKSAEQVKADAETAIKAAEAGTGDPVVAYDKDVNGTTAVDVNDAQLVYDMYMGNYNEFTKKLDMEKFLKADLSDVVAGDDGCLMNVNDVTVIINHIVGN